MNTLKNNTLWIFILTLPLLGCKKNVDQVELISPDGLYTFNLDVKDTFAYSVDWNNTAIIEKSALGFKLSDGTILPDGVTIVKIEKASNHTSWKPVYGEKSEYTDHYNELIIQLKSIGLQGEFALRVRAYNEGVVFRYEINSNEDLQIDNELTEFTYPVDANVWVSTAAQSEIKKHRLSELSFIAERPLLAELSDSVFTAIGEAALVDFARMKFEKHLSKTNTLVASLEKGKEDEYPVSVAANASLATANTTLANAIAAFDAIDPTIAAAESPEAKAEAIRNLLAAKPGVKTEGNLEIADPKAKISTETDWEAINNLPHNIAVDENL